MRQPELMGAEQVPVASSQVSVVQENASEQVLPVVHVPVVVHTPQLATRPSLQRTLDPRPVHAVWLVVGWHDWQTFEPFTAPLV
jgi:hypothetical protein